MAKLAEFSFDHINPIKLKKIAVFKSLLKLGQLAYFNLRR
jgi:hypothetical protein